MMLKLMNDAAYVVLRGGKMRKHRDRIDDDVMRFVHVAERESALDNWNPPMGSDREDKK